MDIFQVFKALSEDVRFKIVMLLSKKDFCVCELTELLSISQPRASKHLKYLKDLGIVRTYRDQKFRFYTINREHSVINDVIELLMKYEDHYQPLMSKVGVVCRCMLDFSEPNDE